MKFAFHKTITLALLVQSLTGLAALAFFMYLGTYSRFWADDFCYFVTFENSQNIFQAIQTFYFSWSNRYTNILLIGLVGIFGRQAIIYLPAVMIGLLVLSLFILLQQLKSLLRLSISPLISLNLAVFLTFLAILQTPNRFQSVFWMMGLITYFAPILFWTWITTMLLWSHAQQIDLKKHWFGPIGLALLAFLAGGLSETTLTFQITFLGLFLLATLLGAPANRTALLFGSVALAASLIAFLVVFLSPGNTIRLETMPEETQFTIEKITLIFIFTWDFIRDTTRSLLAPTLVSVLSAFSLALAAFHNHEKPTPRRFWLILALVPPTAYLLIASMVTPSVYVYGAYGYPEPRALFPAQFVLTASLMTIGFLLGWQVTAWLRQKSDLLISSGKIVISVFLLAAAAYPLWFLQREIQTVPQFARHAERWDARNAYLIEQRRQGNLDVVLDGIQSPGKLIELRENPNFWVNLCVADFYDLNSIAVFP